jgi:hypothetical protein
MTAPVQTATRSRFDTPPPAPHPFVPERTTDWGYRVRCAAPGCGRERSDPLHKEAR